MVVHSALLILSAALGFGCASAKTQDFAQTQVAADGGRENYPIHWWSPIDRASAPSWEILPQEAGPGEVILSKRNELGILSNFAATPFEYRGKTYASLEGFWQAMLFPESKKDARATHPGLKWPATRAQVEQMTAFEAKRAGDQAKENMRIMGIDWVTFEGKQFPYRSKEGGEHFRLIWEATQAKVAQNPKVREVLLATGQLKMRPDHKQDADSPPEWRYFELYEKIREELSRKL